MAALLIDKIDDNTLIQLDKMAAHSDESSTDLARFLLAASLYHAQKISFHAAASSSGLSFNLFKKRLKYYFSTGYIMSQEGVEDEIT